MGREYKYSVKRRLTRKLTIIIITSILILEVIVLFFQTWTSTRQSNATQGYLIDLQTSGFASELLSRSGKISQKIQHLINDTSQMIKNLKLLHNGTLTQAQPSTYERSNNYFN